jgi:dipicolinate synthase subunit B
VAVSTNDGLAGAAENIGRLLARKNYYFVPFGQDDPRNKPASLVADFSRIPQTMDMALLGKQLQPILL